MAGGEWYNNTGPKKLKIKASVYISVPVYRRRADLSTIKRHGKTQIGITV